MLPEQVERLALLGWRLHPASQHTKAACIKNAADHATYDLDQLAAWHREFAPCNWRVTLEGSGIWAMDVDVPGPDHSADGIKALHDLCVCHGPIPPRPMTRSGGGGCALFFAHRGEAIIGKTGQPAPGLDPRRGRLSITVPPSIHVATKRPYRWITPPWELTPPPAPAWLLRLLEPPPEPSFRRPEIVDGDRARNRLYRAAQAVMDAVPGSRNETLNRRAYQVGRLISSGMLHEREAVETLYGAARHSGLDHPEAKATIRSGITSGIRRGPYA